MAGSKRAATRDINHDNWDQEDEPETAGIFQKASEDVLKARVFKTARRRGIHSTQPEVWHGYTNTPSQRPGITRLHVT